MDKISNAYPPGTCSLHPAIECFHHRVADLHFALDRPKKIVWAAAMKKGTASLISPPLGCSQCGGTHTCQSSSPFDPCRACRPTNKSLFKPVSISSHSSHPVSASHGLPTIPILSPDGILRSRASYDALARNSSSTLTWTFLGWVLTT
ncbi:hypothetical protein K438DRAFT_1850243 [Mycena galopus ATCC 62051]|nr:hypothetical protein K438DRAFT_1850243 [Mycena galopus ATCC 62051]